MESNTPELAEVEPTNIGKLNNENVVPILQEKESEMNEMEAKFLSKISGLVKELEEKDNERGQVEIEEHVELKDTDEKYRFELNS